MTLFDEKPDLAGKRQRMAEVITKMMSANEAESLSDEEIERTLSGVSDARNHIALAKELRDSGGLKYKDLIPPSYMWVSKDFYQDRMYYSQATQRLIKEHVTKTVEAFCMCVINSDPNASFKEQCDDLAVDLMKGISEVILIKEKR